MCFKEKWESAEATTASLPGSSKPAKPSRPRSMPWSAAYAMEGHVECLMVGIGAGVHHRRFGIGGKTKESTQSLAAKLLEHRSARRDLPVGHALVIVESDTGSEPSALFRKGVEHGLKGGLIVVHQVGDESLVDEAAKLVERQSLVAETNERAQIVSDLFRRSTRVDLSAVSFAQSAVMDVSPPSLLGQTLVTINDELTAGKDLLNFAD